jgi:hypothetical protein
MLSAALIAERAESFVRRERGLSGARLVEFQTRFKAMVFPGEALAIGGIVKEVSETTLVLELLARNPKGDLVTSGVANYALA